MKKSTSGDEPDYLLQARKLIAGRLKKAIKTARVSQNGLARILGTTGGTVSAWTKGRTQPSLEQFAMVCHALQLSADQILAVSPRQYPELPHERVRALAIGYSLTLGHLQEAAKQRPLTPPEQEVLRVLKMRAEATMSLADKLVGADKEEALRLVGVHFVKEMDEADTHGGDYDAPATAVGARPAISRKHSARQGRRKRPATGG